MNENTPLRLTSLDLPQAAAPAPARGVSLWRHLALLCAGLALPILLFVGFLLWQFAAAERTRLESDALDRARAIAQAVDRTLEAMSAALNVLAASPSLRTGDLAAFHALASEAAERTGYAVVLRDRASGRQLLSTRAPFGTPLPIANAPAPPDGPPRVAVSDLFVGARSGVPQFAVQLPVSAPGQPDAVLGLSIPVEAIRDVILAEEPRPSLTVAVIDRAGRILARNSRHEDFVGRPATPDLQENTLGREGTWDGFTIDGQPVLGAYSRSRLADWRVAVGLRRAELSAPLRRSLWTFAALGAGLIVLSTLLALFFGRRIARPMQAVAAQARRLARRDPVEPVASPIREIDEVGQALAAASVGLRERERERDVAEAALREETKTLETLNRTGAAVAGELDLERVVQMVSDAAVELTGAKFGAFFYNQIDEAGESYALYTLSGVPRSAFERFPMPRNTAVFGPTFAGEGVVRSDDIKADPRYGHNAPYKGMPEGHLPVTSYLAVPVVSRSGEVIGGLFFGHPEPARFTARHERMIVGIAAQAAIAIDNARLYQSAQRELRQRRTAEERLRDLNQTLEQRIGEAMAEREKTEAQLRQAQKMEAIGQLTGGVAHDFNNLLTVIAGNLDIIRRRLGPAADFRLERNVDNALEGARRAAQLTHRLLAFSRQSPLQPETVDLNKLVAGMSDLLRRTLGEHIAIESVLAGGLWRTEADPNQIESALLNLAVNARDAMPDGGKLTIETANAHIDEGYAGSAEGEVKPGQYVLLSVSDTGIGMTPEVRAKVFEPFFTTKPVGKGTGLGLAQVYGFMRQSGGHAAIYSEPGQGTTVKLYFPRLSRRDDQVAAPASSAAPTDAPVGRGQTVLVVEDERLVRDFSVSALEDAGYAVLAAEDGPTALRLLAEHADVALLFTDVVLAGPMNGRKVADEALRLRPDLKVLFTTGYTRNAIIHHGRLDEDVEVIGKPFTAAALARRVRDLLDAEPRPEGARQ